MSRGWVYPGSREDRGEYCPEGVGMSRGCVPTPCHQHLVAATTRTVVKQAVHILLECFLVCQSLP